MIDLRSLTIRSFALALALGGPYAGAQSRQSAIKVTEEAVTYKTTAATLEAVKFGELSYSLDGETIALRKGSYSLQEEGSFGNASLDHTWTFDIQGGKARHALVSLAYTFGGGSSQCQGFLFVFELRYGHPVAIQQFMYDAQVKGSGAKFDPATGKLTVTGRSNDGSPHCCPKNVDVVTYAWTPKGFVQTGRRVVPAPR